jgi:hypothetical protein
LAIKDYAKETSLMVRSIWKKTLVASLAWAGLALGQQPFIPAQPVTATPAPERTLTVQEPGKPAQKCAILKTWKTAEGSTAYQVKVLTTGEMMTIVENGKVTTVPGRQPGSRLQAITTRIFHWGQSSLPPSGTPLPPAETVQTITPTPVMRQEVITEEVQQPRQRLLPRIFNRNRDESTVVETRPYTPLPASSYAPADGSTPSTTITSVSSPVTAPAPVAAPPARTPAVLPPVSGAEQGRIQTTRLQPIAAATVPATATTNGSATAATPAEPTDWRRSWGKTDEHRSRLIPKILPVKDKDENRDANSESRLPVNQNMQSDPLRAPDQYTSDKLEKKYAAGNSKAVQKTSESPRPTFTAWLATQHAEPAPKPAAPQPVVAASVRQSTSDTTRGEAAPVQQTSSAPTDQSSAGPPQIPLGTASILAASEAAGVSPGYVPAPIISMPVNPQPMGLPPSVPQPPQIYSGPMPPQIYSGQGYAYGPAYRALGQSPTTTDPGVANAFIGMPTRETVAQTTNAFGPGTQGMMGGPQTAGGMYPSNPYGQMAQQVPAVQAVVPAAQPIVSAGYQVPPADSSIEPKGQSLSDLTKVLRDALYPSQRERAAEKMCAYDWRLNPQVATALVKAAQEDPAPTVRMQCIHCLARMRVNSPAALRAIRSLRSDPDGRVRQEADQAEVILGSYGH